MQAGPGDRKYQEESDMLGIIGAMAQEVAALKEAMSGVEVRTAAGMDFYKGTIDGKDAVVVRPGGRRSISAISCCLPTRFSMTWTPPASVIRWA